MNQLNNNQGQDSPEAGTFELRGVSKKYGDVYALHPADLTITDASTCVLIGPSGCGKSTVIRLMIGLIQPDGGQLLFEGQELGRHNLLESRRKMGYVIQDGGLFPHMTAKQNITLMAQHLRRPAAHTAARLDELVSLTRFPPDGLEKYPRQLSGGQRQRVSLMRALVLDPDVLLLDEPLGALDPMMRNELQHDLREIFLRLKKTVVMVTHDLSEAAFLGKTIVLMRHGRIVQQGCLRELVESPADPFVTEFINAQRSLHEIAEQPETS